VYIANPINGLIMATTTKATSPASKKPVTSRSVPPRQNVPLFGKENYRWMLIGIIIMALGLFLMAGGKSKDPNVFDPKEVYSFTRITIAPILILGGLALEIFAIFRKDKTGEKNIPS
jgi:Protein of unknown function (DUF3098)